MARTLLYFIAGGLVGFLLLGEFRIATLIPVLIALLVLALIAVVGGVRRRSWSAWSVFLLAAMVVPLIIDGQIVGLPRCTEVPAGVHCVGGERDYRSPFWFEIAIFALAIVGTALHVRTARPTQQTPRA